MSKKGSACSATGSWGPFFALLTCLVLIVSLVAPWFIVVLKESVLETPESPFTYSGESITLFSWNDAFCYHKTADEKQSGFCPSGVHYKWRKVDWCETADCSRVSNLFWISLGLITVSIALSIAVAVIIFRRCCSIRSAPGRSKFLIISAVLGFVTTVCAMALFSSILPNALKKAELPLCLIAAEQHISKTPCNNLFGSLILLGENKKSEFSWLPGGWIAAATAAFLWIFVIYFAAKPVPEPEFKHAQYNDMSRPMIDQTNVADYYYY